MNQLSATTILRLLGILALVATIWAWSLLSEAIMRANGAAHSTITIVTPRGDSAASHIGVRRGERTALAPNTRPSLPEATVSALPGTLVIVLALILCLAEGIRTASRAAKSAPSAPLPKRSAA